MIKTCFNIRVGCVVAALLVPAAATTNETITYTYDARGRLIEVDHSGTVNEGVSTTYTLDKADNRTNKTTTGTAPTLSIGNASATEGGNLSFTVTRSGPTAAAASVDYASTDATALAGSDYATVSGTLGFASGETSKSVTVVTIDDSDLENNETLTVALSNVSAGTSIATAQGTGTINDNEVPPAPSFSVSDASVTEGGNLVFTITKIGITRSNFSVQYATADGTASSKRDYSAKSGTLTFEPTESSKTVSVTTRRDSENEGNETVLMNLSNASGGATISDSQGVGTIID